MRVLTAAGQVDLGWDNKTAATAAETDFVASSSLVSIPVNPLTSNENHNRASRVDPPYSGLTIPSYTNG